MIRVLIKPIQKYPFTKTAHIEVVVIKALDQILNKPWTNISLVLVLENIIFDSEAFLA